MKAQNNLVAMIFGVCCSYIFQVNCSDHVILETENLKTDDRGGREERQSSNYRLACPGLAKCVTLRECPQILAEATTRCYNSDRSMFCGVNQNFEPYVCCPIYTSPNFLSDQPPSASGSSAGSAIGTGGSAPGNNFNNFNGLDRLSGVCGKTLIQGNAYRKLGAYPFVARIGFKNINTGNLAYPCTGSIISRRVILTAGHCALAKAEGHRLSSVRIGEFDITKDPDCADSGFCAPSAINHAVSHVIVHPDYVNGQYHHDIALLILRTPINYTVAAQPVCLQRDRANLVVGRRSQVVGWGKVSLSNIRAPEMQYMDVPLSAWDQCLRVYGSSGALESQKSIEGQWMCAGGEGRDVCQGFGGAPLLVSDNGITSQIGIMSFGSENCGGIRIPSVYTSIAHFYNWIVENVPIE